MSVVARRRAGSMKQHFHIVRVQLAAGEARIDEFDGLEFVLDALSLWARLHAR
jgi:hypothetical protein